MIDTLRQQIREVARLRQQSQNNKDLVDMAKAAWETQHAAILLVAAESARETKEAEDKLRQMTLECYTATEDKHPAEGVEIKEVKKLEYETEKAFQWAQTHNLALRLDDKVFETITKAQIKEDKDTGELRLPEELFFVTAKKVPQAMIATDLSKFVKEG